MGFRLLGRRATFILMMFLTTAFFLVEIIVGYITNSMALVADSFHMLSDIISLFVGFFALKLSQKNSNFISGNTFGWVRAEVLGALINAVFLVALCLSIFISAVKRLVQPEPLTQPLLILIVGSIGLLVNILGMLLFHGHAGGHGHSHGGGHGHSHGGSGHGHHNDTGGIGKNDKNGFKRKDVHAIENISQKQQIPKQRLSVTDGTTIVPINLCAPPSPSMVRFQERARNIKVILQPESMDNNPDVTIAVATIEERDSKNEGQMNMRGVYLHILGDALGSVIVIIAALIVKYVKQGWTLYVDPALSVIMVGIILYSCIPLLKESSQILLQNVPPHIQLNQLENRLLSAFPEIVGIHEFHVWQLAGSKIIASVHVKFTSNADYNRLSPNLKEFFHSEGIHSTTFQPEFEQGNDEVASKKCLLSCISKSCQEKLCCTADNVADKGASEEGADIVETPPSIVIDPPETIGGLDNNALDVVEEEDINTENKEIENEVPVPKIIEVVS